MHQFAFYTPVVSSIVERGLREDIYEITEPELVHRISSVLRLNKGDTIILFDTHYHSVASILGIQPKKSIAVEIHAVEANVPLTPSITWLLPLLKREAFEEALYTLVELGVHVVQPVLTRKTSKVWWSEKEVGRSRKIMIAAAEQSKQFIFPLVMPLIPLDIWLAKPQNPRTIKLFFDPLGNPLKTVLSSLEETVVEEIIGFAGPEGDLTKEEKDALIHQSFIFCKLTSTVLRAQQALTIGLGALRSLL